MGSIDDVQLAELRGALQKVLGRVELRVLAPAVLERAAQPFSSVLGTLNALYFDHRHTLAAATQKDDCASDAP